jgi:hypothetical protein
MVITVITTKTSAAEALAETGDHPMNATLTLDSPARTELPEPVVHVIRWHSLTTDRDYVIVGLVTGRIAGEYEDLTHVIKFDALTATVVAEFDELAEVARSADVPGYRIPGDADWWRALWVRCQRQHALAAVDHLALLGRLDEAMS